MKQYYIYLTTNMINNKQYIGQHYGELDDSYLGSGSLIAQAIKKYGKNNFSKEILQICNDQKDADLWEKYYIQKFQAVEKDCFYNLQEGGSNGDGWRTCHNWMKEHPEEAQQIYQQNIQNLHQWRNNHPEEFYQKAILPLIEGNKKWRQEHPEEVQKIIKKLQEGKVRWQQGHPEEHQQQVNNWRKLGTQANSKKTICLTTGEVFNSQSEAARFYNIPQANISKCIKGERKSAGKHPVTQEKLLWAYVED